MEETCLASMNGTGGSSDEKEDDGRSKLAGRKPIPMR